MQPFTIHTGTVVPLPRDNIDTDQIIPARFLHRDRADGFADALFHDIRSDAEGFTLARPDAEPASIIVAGANFGCGSSREHAVWALMDAGYRVVIASSIGEIFQNNAAQNGLLAIGLGPAQTERLLRLALTSAELRLRVDIETQTIETIPADQGGEAIPFEIDPFHREALRRGLSEIEMTLEEIDAIAVFEKKREAAEPWLASPF